MTGQVFIHIHRCFALLFNNNSQQSDIFQTQFGTATSAKWKSLSSWTAPCSKVLQISGSSFPDSRFFFLRLSDANHTTWHPELTTSQGRPSWSASRHSTFTACYQTANRQLPGSYQAATRQLLKLLIRLLNDFPKTRMFARTWQVSSWRHGHNMPTWSNTQQHATTCNNMQQHATT